MTRHIRLLGLVLPLLTGCFGAARLHDMAVGHNARAAELIGEGSLGEARGALEVALEYNPRFAEAHANLGLVAIRQGRLAEAEGHLQRAVSLNPDFAEAWTNLAAISLQAGRVDEAVLRVRRAVEVDPDFSEARSLLVRLLVARGRLDDAERQAYRLVAVRPDEAESHAVLAMVALAVGHRGQARREISRAATLDDGSPLMVEVRGRVCFLDGRWAEAARDLGSTVERRPADGQLRYLHGLALLQQGELDGAAAAFEQVLVARPGHARALSALALVEAGRGRDTEARRLVARSLELHPGLDQARQVRDLLD